jgi:hypothetical protein
VILEVAQWQKHGLRVGDSAELWRVWNLSGIHLLASVLPDWHAQLQASLLIENNLSLWLIEINESSLHLGR